MSREAMKRIKTWSERCEEHPDHQQGMISEGMIRARMQEEIDELRQALETEPLYWNVADGWVYADDMNQDRVDETAKHGHEWVGLTDQEIGEVISGQFAERNYWVKITKALESKLKEKNT